MFLARLQVAIDFGNPAGALIFSWGFTVEFALESIFLYHWSSKLGIQDFHNFKTLDSD